MGLGRLACFDERKRLVRALVIGSGLAPLLILALHPQEAFLLAFLVAIGQDQILFFREALRLDVHQTRDLFGQGLSRRALLVKATVVFTFLSIGVLTLFINELKSQQTQLPFAIRTSVYFACLLGIWLQMHNSFALLYAKLYFSLNPIPSADGPNPQGFIFAGPDEPVFSDFLYVSYAVGLTYAMSDTNLEDSKVRRIVLIHALLSFLFLSIVLSELIHLLGSLS
jgi:uncharacterized membrane protein